jgi:hypothetical protein
MALTHNIVIITARPETHFKQTRIWLKRHGIIWAHLCMRDEGDSRDSCTMKKELYQKVTLQIEAFQNESPRFAFAVDDRKDVCEMWQSLEIPTYQITI